MAIAQKAKSYTATQAVRLLGSVLAGASDANLIRLTKALEVIAPYEVYKREMRQLRELFERKAPALELARRFFRGLHPNYRRRMIRNLAVNAAYMSASKREALAKRGLAGPFLIVISPTMRCNLRCTGCYAFNYTRADDLPFDVVDRVITEAKEQGAYFFTITGGEPFIRDDLLEIYKKHNDCAFQIYTNGTLITDEVIEKLVECGNVGPAISIEGWEEQTDARRGPGTFKRIMDTMDRLKEARALFGFSGTVTRYNADIISSSEFIDLMVEKGCLFGWYFIYIPIGREPDTSLMPTPEQRQQHRERVWHARRTKPIFVADFWNDGALTGGCMAGGRLYAHVNNKGDLEPCVFCHFSTDNIKEKSLGEALNSPFFRAIRGRFPWSANHLTPCMIIDHPCVLRECVEEAGAHGTHEGAETIVTDLAPDLDRYSAELEKVTEPIWAELKDTIWPDCIRREIERERQEKERQAATVH